MEELPRAGLEKIVIIVQPEDLPTFENLFREADSPQNFHKLSPASQAYARRITGSIGEKVEFVTQASQEGFGHALHTAAAAVGNEPIVLLIGKHVYKSALPDACCVQQLLDAFYATGTAVMGLKVWLPYSAVLLRLNSRALTRWLFAMRAVVADVL